MPNARRFLSEKTSPDTAVDTYADRQSEANQNRCLSARFK
jgi:hypothetical protein